MRAHKFLQRFSKCDTALDSIILLLIILCLGIQLHLQSIQKINWDEFYFLSLIYEHQRGDLAKPLQTLHVHLFGWLTNVGKDEIDQIVIARFFMWLFQIGSLILAYHTSRFFCGRRASLIGVLGYLCAGYVLIHGTSFRADPIAAFFTMLCIYILTRSKLSYTSLFLMGTTVAVAIHVTVKIVLFLPLFLWLGLWQLPDFKKPFEAVKRLFIAFLVCIVIGGAIYKYQLHIMPDHASTYSASVVSSAPSTLLYDSGFLPRWNFVKESAVLSSPQLLLFLIGMGMCIAQILYLRPANANPLMLLGMAFPLITLLFYRNAFPYFFPFIFLPTICIIAYGATVVQNNIYAVILLTLVLVSNQLLHYSGRIGDNYESQKEIILFLHKAFPEGVNYVDRCSMFGSSKKYGFFMSSLGYKIYKKNGQPVIRKQAIKDVVPIVIANNSQLSYALIHGSSRSNGMLLNDDANFLNRNYSPHWGAIWIAGIDVSASEISTSFEIKLPGIYTIEADFPVIIDGKTYSRGDTLVLERKATDIVSDLTQVVTLRWGDNLYKPSFQPSQKPLFSRF